MRGRLGTPSNTELDAIRSALSYDSETGILTWARDVSCCVKAGSVAGHRRNDSYIIVIVRGKKYAGHRVAWFLHYGEWPNCRTDHRNLNKSDNRISNLRAATHSQNKANSSAPKNNILGIKGVNRTRSGRYAAKIRVNGHLKHLGTFPTPQDANNAYAAAAQTHYGEFSRAA